MKKFFFLFGFLFLTFFSFNSDVHANVHTGISYDAHEKFNIFYELKQNTPMANLLLGKDIKSLSSYLGYDNPNYISISYFSEVKTYLQEGYSLPDNAKYIIFISDSWDGNGKKIPSISRNGDSYKDSTGFSVGGYHDFILLDENANLLKINYDGVIRYNFGVVSFFTPSVNNAFTYKFSGTSKESIENFSYFISHFWYFISINMSGLYEYTYVTDILYDDERLLIDNSEVNKNIFTKIKDSWLSLTNSDSLISASQLNLDYFQKNNYMTSVEPPKDTYTILNYSNSIVPPNGFKSLNFKVDDNTVDGYLFIPKNIDNVMNRDLYGYTSDLPRSSFSNDSTSYVRQGISAFSLNEKNSFSSLGEKNADYLFKYSQNFKLYNLGYKEKLSNKYPDFKSSFTAIWVAHAIKYNSILYYNPKAFQVCPLYTTGTTTDSETGATIFTYSSCSFRNPVNGEQITVSGTDFYDIISSTNTIGASVDITETDEDELSKYDKYNELYETDENGNVTGFSITGVLKELKTFLASFIDVIATIFTSFTLFFNALPLEIRGLLYFSLIGGAIILFWKLIH